MIHVEAFARYREHLGWQRKDLPLPVPPTLGTLLLDPLFIGLPREALYAVNETFAGQETILQDGDHVALLPPVSGG